MIIFYAKVLSVLLPWLGFERVPATGLISKVAIAVLPFQLWMVLPEFFREYSPMKEGYSHVPDFPWVIMGLLIPILVAGIFHSIASSKLALRNEPEPGDLEVHAK